MPPPPGTVVSCIDEKTGIQAKYRKYPERPPRPDRVARREFECTDPRLNIHLVMDNGSSHTSAATRACLRTAARRRVHLPRRPHHQDHRLHDPLQPHREALDLVYDARADHAPYRVRHGGQHPATAETGAAQTLLQAA
jgi:hypothetical protein